MKINNIALQNFRIYEQETIAFSEPLSVFKGDNHSGKSSLAQAIKLTLSKCADGTDPRGAGALDKVRLGANKAIIDTVIEGKQGLVTLTTQYGPGKTGRTQRIKTDPENEKVAAGFDKYLDANQERLSCVLDSSYFTSQKPEAQKAILATLVLPTSYEFDPKMVDLAVKHLGGFLWGDNPVKVIDQVYEAAYGARRTAKTTLASIRVPATPQKPEYGAEVVQGKLMKLRSEAAKESKAISGGGTVAIGKIEQQIENGKLQLEDAIESQSMAAADRAGIDEKLLTSTALDKVQRLAAGRKLFDQIKAKKEAQAAEVRAQREAQSIYAELLQDEAGKDVDRASCPTCTQSITRNFIDGKIAEHRGLEVQADVAWASLDQEQKELGDIAKAEGDIQANANLVNLKDQLVRQEAELAAKIIVIKQNIDTLTSQLAVAKANEQAPADTTALDALNAEIAQWEARLSPAVNYDATLKQIETLTAQWSTQKEAVDDLETLCEHFGKDGIKAELIAKHIGEFSETVNGVLAAWGYSAKLEMEPYEFIVSTAQGNTLPLKELSGSEKLMFSVALQTAIAVHGKIRMVVVDDGDTFVGPERGRLLRCLKKLLDAGTLDQALVFASEVDRTKIAKPGVATYWVEAGKVSVL